MICSLVKNLMDLYVTGRLAEFEARWMKTHVESCGRCAAEAAAWETLFEGLRVFPAAPEPAGLKAVLKAAVSAAVRAENAPAPELVVDRRSDPEPELSDGCRRDPAPSLVFAFGFAVFFVSVSMSVFGPGVSSQTSGESSPAGVSQIVSSTSVSGVRL